MDKQKKVHVELQKAVGSRQSGEVSFDEFLSAFKVIVWAYLESIKFPTSSRVFVKNILNMDDYQTEKPSDQKLWIQMLLDQFVFIKCDNDEERAEYKLAKIHMQCDGLSQSGDQLVLKYLYSLGVLMQQQAKNCDIEEKIQATKKKVTSRKSRNSHFDQVIEFLLKKYSSKTPRAIFKAIGPREKKAGVLGATYFKSEASVVIISRAGTYRRLGDQKFVAEANRIEKLRHQFGEFLDSNHY